MKPKHEHRSPFDRLRVTSGIVAAAAIIAIVASGCTRFDRAPSSPVAFGDPARGRQVFSAACARCHGATGTEGGVGPSLRDEKKRKNYVQTYAWIKNPDPPMPKLYPAPLDDQAVRDVAAYVQKL
jgi:mono/diheme cytochrome c family protein